MVITQWQNCLGTKAFQASKLLLYRQVSRLMLLQASDGSLHIHFCHSLRHTTHKSGFVVMMFVSIFGIRGKMDAMPTAGQLSTGQADGWLLKVSTGASYNLTKAVS